MATPTERLIEKGFLEKIPDDKKDGLQHLDGYMADHDFAQELQEKWLERREEDGFIVREMLQITVEEMLDRYEDEELSHIGQDLVVFQKHFPGIRETPEQAEERETHPDY